MSINEDEIAALAAQIQHYLEAYPAAADTLDGIVSWWLPYQRDRQTAENVERALDALAAAGVVEKLKRSDGRVIYRCAHHHRGRGTRPASRLDS